MAEKKPRDQSDFTGTVKPTTADTSGFGAATGPGAGENTAPEDNPAGEKGKNPRRPGPSGEK